MLVGDQAATSGPQIKTDTHDTHTHKQHTGKMRLFVSPGIAGIGLDHVLMWFDGDL